MFHHVPHHRARPAASTLSTLAAAAAALLLAAASPAAAVVTTGPGGSGVTVGNSSLIGARDYSDSWTLTESGGIPGRTPNTFPVPPEGLAVENNHGNPPQTWPASRWSISNDANVINGNLAYPGGNGSGSDTGMTQTGGGVDFAIPYGLRGDFVLQTDAVVVADRVNVFASQNGDISSGLAVFFRADSVAGTPHPAFPEGLPGIGVFNGTTETPIRTGPNGESGGYLLTGTSVGQWNNFAVRFNQDADTLEFFVNEVSVKQIDLTTFAGGAYQNYSTAMVGVGGSGSDRTWTDNFQVGAPVPEPASLALLALGGVGLLARRRR